MIVHVKLLLCVVFKKTSKKLNYIKLQYRIKKMVTFILDDLTYDHISRNQLDNGRKFVSSSRVFALDQSLKNNKYFTNGS